MAVKIVLKIILIVSGVLLIANSLYLTAITNFNSGIVIPLGVGLLFVLYGIFFNKVNAVTRTGVPRIIKYAVFAGFIFIFGLMIFLAAFGNMNNVTYKEDVIVVLGAGIKGETPNLILKGRLDKAVEYYSQNPNAVIVVSGGQGFQEDIPEGLAMERYLVARGIPIEKILKEEKATDTLQNFKLSKKILDNYFTGKTYKTALITNDFHVYRATETAKIAGLNCTHYFAQTDWKTLPLNYFRESAAVINLWIFKN